MSNLTLLGVTRPPLRCSSIALPFAEAKQRSYTFCSARAPRRQRLMHKSSSPNRLGYISAQVNAAQRSLELATSGKARMNDASLRGTQRECILLRRPTRFTAGRIHLCGPIPQDSYSMYEMHMDRRKTNKLKACILFVLITYLAYGYPRHVGEDFLVNI